MAKRWALLAVGGMKERIDRLVGRLLAVRFRSQVIIGFLALFLVYTIGWNVLLYPDYFAALEFEWNSEAGFTHISCGPRNRLNGIQRFYASIIEWQAKPWFSRELRKAKWTSAGGVWAVHTFPFPPIVTGVNFNFHGKLIDPQITPLMQAAASNNLQLVKLVLASGADVNAKDQRNWTALMHACMKKGTSGQIIQTLIGEGAEVNAKDSVGRTALIWATWNCGTDETANEKVRLLLEAKADPNARSNYDETPLSSAVAMGKIEIVAQLLDAKADPNSKGVSGRSPLSIARLAGNIEMIDLLRRAGAHE